MRSDVASVSRQAYAVCTPVLGAQGHSPSSSPLRIPSIVHLLHFAGKEAEAETECDVPELHMCHSRTRPRLLASDSGFSREHPAAATSSTRVPGQLPHLGSCLVIEGMGGCVLSCPACDSSLGKRYLLTLVPQAQSCWFSAAWWPTSGAGPHHPATHPNHPPASSSPPAPVHLSQPTAAWL